LPPLSWGQTSQVPGLHRLNDSKKSEMKVDRASIYSRQSGESVKMSSCIVRKITSDRDEQSTVDKRYNSKISQHV
jgi:hypothetical protein